MTLQELTQALGAYYRQHATQIDQALLHGFESRSTYTPIFGVVDQYVTKTKHLQKVLQPHLRGFTPHDDKMRFLPEIHRVERAKINYEISDDDIIELERSALGYMLQGTGSNPTQQARSIASMVINSLLDRADEELEFEVHYAGVRSEPTYPTPGEPREIIDGLGKKLDDAVTAGKLITMGMGDYTNAEFLQYVEQFVGDLPDRAKKRRMEIECSLKNLENYWDNRRTLYGQNMDYDPNRPLFIKNYPNITLRGIPGMGESKRIVTTVPGNKIAMYGRQNEERNITITYKPDEQVVRFTAHFKMAVGYRSYGVPGTGRLEDQLVFMNDVA